MSPGMCGVGARLGSSPCWVPRGNWVGPDLVPSGLKTVVGQWGEAGWPGPVGHWGRSVGSGLVGWWPGTLLSYWRCTAASGEWAGQKEGNTGRVNVGKEKKGGGENMTR